jgi:hypothetical protein
MELPSNLSSRNKISNSQYLLSQGKNSQNSIEDKGYFVATVDNIFMTHVTDRSALMA